MYLVFVLSQIYLIKNSQINKYRYILITLVPTIYLIMFNINIKFPDLLIKLLKDFNKQFMSIILVIVSNFSLIIMNKLIEILFKIKKLE